MVKPGYSYRELDQLIFEIQRKAEAFLQGRHEGLKTGIGITFSHYRQYMPGDDLRTLDWKMYAKTGKFYVKMSEIETNLRLKLIVDATSSMLHPVGDSTKWNYIQKFLAGFIYVAHRSGDRLNLQWVGGTDEQVIRKLDISHWQNLAVKIFSTSPSGNDSTGEKEITWKHMLPDAEEEVVILTDGYDDRFKKFIEKYSTPKKHITLLHVLSPEELELNYNYESFQDLETGKILTTSTNKAKGEYLKKLNKFIAEWKEVCYSNGADYRQLILSDDPVKLLVEFLTGKHRI
ncbi:DUF58 domain-containing protein [Mangrovivirga sp. M17]|uniref:DUF58 domain-containing protein n=1 Tax=Mangrovivirga halotolerans TaxID=2993936 RepID=A0ABT3RY36_9BACT|nr:DUF58 domain-containing protein [Mangrovivirga halotolerans]MCX2746122.1 DUF58 domain-containing protein [Mangrovivirga halotolerans]